MKRSGVLQSQLVIIGLRFLCSTTTSALSVHQSVFASPSLCAHGGTSVIVVGGGPVGLAAALTLASPPHNCQVTVLEKAGESLSQSSYDPTRSYLYNVNPRGLVWFDHMEESYRQDNGEIESPLSKLNSKGYAPPGGRPDFTIVPSDPDTPFATTQGAAQISREANVTVPSRRNYWISRHIMVQAMQDLCIEFGKESSACGDSEEHGTITLKSNKSVDSLSSPVGEDIVRVHCDDGSSYSANLVVAADGVDSSVRNFLAQKSKARDANASWLHSTSRRFLIKRYKSPSTGLQLRALQFPSNFTIPVNSTVDLQTVSTTLYSIRGRHSGPRNRVSIGFLPVKDPDLVRPGNFIVPMNHLLMSLDTGERVKAWVRDAFPRLKWEDLISEQEWKRFAEAKGTTFPFCQYSRGTAVSNGRNAGVALVGDAAHAFPPDIGEGINAGFQDVVALDQALRGKEIQTTNSTLPENNVSTFPETLADALQHYQSNRGPEHKALIRLARFGSPYQYRQPLYRDRVGRFLWTLNVVFRMMLKKVSFGKIPPAAIVLAAYQPGLTYRQVMRRADSAVLVLKSIAALLLGMWLKKFLPL